MMDFSDRMRAGRRLVILRVLAGMPQYSGHEYRIAGVMEDDHGESASRDQLRGELGWLEEQGLVICQSTSQGLWVATLTVRGEDVACGRTEVPGVARPRPEY